MKKKFSRNIENYKLLVIRILFFSFSAINFSAALGAPPEHAPKHWPLLGIPSSLLSNLFSNVQVTVGQFRSFFALNVNINGKQDLEATENASSTQNTSSPQDQGSRPSFLSLAFPPYVVEKWSKSRSHFTSESPRITVGQLVSNVQMTVDQFRSFLNLLPTAVIIANQAGKITLVNDAAAKFFGYTVLEMEGFPQARHLKGKPIQGLTIASLMPPEIAQIHPNFVTKRLNSREHRIGKGPREVIVKIRKDSGRMASAHQNLSQSALMLSEEIQLRQLYTRPRFMTPTNPRFTQEEGFEFALAQMTLGDITLGEEAFYIGFFDNSVADRRKTAVATRIAAHAIDRSRSFDALLDEQGNTDFSQEFQNVTIVFVNLLTPPHQMKGRSLKTPFADINALLSRFDEVLGQFPTATKIGATRDGYLYTVGLGSELQKPLSSRHSFSDLSTDTNTAILISRQLIDVARGHTLCEQNVEVRVGIHVGPVTAGLLGTTTKEFDIIGDTVTLAMKLGSTGQSGKIQITEAVRDYLDFLEQETFVKHENGKLIALDYLDSVFISK